MRASIGYGGSIELADNHRCDYALYDGRTINTVIMDVWKQDNPRALFTIERRFFRWEIVLGRDRKLTRKLVDRKFRKMIDEVNVELRKCGVDDEIAFNT